jgi:multidrug efflux pump subunit AcrB
MLALAGIRGFHQLTIQNLPDLDLPTVNITLAQPGAAPAQLETEVARKVENSLASLSGLKHLRTTISDGIVQISVEFVLEKKLSDALIETKDAVDRVRSDLPNDLLQPGISSDTSGRNPILTYAVTSKKLNTEALSWFIDNQLNKALLSIPGVGRFERLGGVQREIRVEVDPVRLSSMGATAADVSRALKRMQQESSGGQSQLGQTEQSIRTIATVKQVSELSVFPVAITDGREIRLDQVATVSDTTSEIMQVAFLDGRPVVGFNLYRAKGSDETKIATRVQDVLKQLKSNDSTLELTEISGSVNYTNEQYRGSMQMLYEGAILAILVVWGFLRDWRATLVAAAALPLSILPAFAVMSWMGYSLNTLTLLALAVTVGILVDDAIVEIENIERHRRMGKSIVEATGDAVNEIALAVIATTITLVVVFVPTALMSGVPGLFFRQFGWTAVIAVLSSLLVARMLTPVMATWLLKPNSSKEENDGVIMQGYMVVMKWCLSHRKTTLFAACVFFLGSIAIVPFIPTGLIPASDRGYTTINFELPPGSSVQNTIEVAEHVRATVQGVNGVRSVFTVAGNPHGSADSQTTTETHKGTLTLTLTSRNQRKSQIEIEKDIRKKLTSVPGARFTVGAGSPGEKLTLILTSDNAEILKKTAQIFVRELRSIESLSNISSSGNLERPEIIIRPYLRRAAELGVTTQSIGEVVRIATKGDFDAQLAKFNLDTRQVNIRVRIADILRQDIDTLGNIRVMSRNGLVPISSLAALSVESGPSKIERYDRRRYVTISADLGGTPLGKATAAANALPIVQGLPSSVQLIQTGDAEISAELTSGFGLAILTGVICMFCVLVVLFKDFLQPITILSAIPLSLGGAFLALLLTHSELDVPSMIGLVMLMGIVTKNSILLVEYAVVGINQRDMSLLAALIDACHKRARPIVMTTIAMIAGMLPIALGLGADASFRQPMAIAVIGGLFTSTLLSLLVVPVVFTYIHKIDVWFTHRLKRPSSEPRVSLVTKEHPL